VAKPKKVTKVQQNFGDMVAAVHGVLADAGLDHLTVESIKLRPKTQSLSAGGPGVSPCPAGQVPVTVCEEMPDGSIHCHIECRPQ